METNICISTQKAKVKIVTAMREKKVVVVPMA